MAAKSLLSMVQETAAECLPKGWRMETTPLGVAVIDADDVHRYTSASLDCVAAYVQAWRDMHVLRDRLLKEWTG